MNIKKSLIALAVASSIAPFAAQAADVTVSGIVQTKIQYTDVGDDDTLGIAAGDVRLNFAAEDTRGGITGYANYRLDADALSNRNANDAIPLDNDGETVNLDDNGVTPDNIYVGLKGGFGDIRLGEVDVMADYGRKANDLHDIAGDYEQHLAYTNSFGGFDLGLAYGFEDDNLTGNDDAFVGVGAKFAVGGLSLGAGYDNAGEDRYSVGAQYDFGPAFLAAHFGQDGSDADIFAVKGGVTAGNWDISATYSQKDEDSEIIQVNADASLTDALTLNLRYQTEDEEDATAADTDAFRILLGYSF